MKINLLIFSLMAITVSISNIAYAGPYAVEVIDFQNPRSGPFTNPLDALGAPDGAFDDLSGLYSMGEFGSITLRLGQPVIDIPGFDFAVWEESTYFDDPANRSGFVEDIDENLCRRFPSILFFMYSWSSFAQAKACIVFWASYLRSPYPSDHVTTSFIF